MSENKELGNILYESHHLSSARLMKIVVKLSIPTMIAQLSAILMQYIDAAMVGSLGAKASASIGIVSSSTWLLGGLCSSFGIGFAVQVAHFIGGKNEEGARRVVKNGYFFCFVLSIILSIMGSIIAFYLPGLLGAEKAIQSNSSYYFLIFCLSIPFLQISYLSTSLLQCSGNMRMPSILNASMCFLDVIFNFIFIRFYGVVGAAIGTALAESTVALILLYMVLYKSNSLHLRKEGNFKLDFNIFKKAMKISIPMAFEHTAMCSAQIMSTKIIAPLGSVSIAANSFAVTAESLCYMPGYGIGSAATTLVGQALGARNVKLAKRFSSLTVVLGCAIMGLAGVIMYFIAPYIFMFLTPDLSVRALSTQILRIEVWAEPLYALSIVASGALRGAGDTLVPSIMNLLSIWGVRITLSIILVGQYGLVGVWIAMCIELCFRGSIFFIRLKRNSWIKKYNIEHQL